MQTFSQWAEAFWSKPQPAVKVRQAPPRPTVPFPPGAILGMVNIPQKGYVSSYHPSLAEYVKSRDWTAEHMRIDTPIRQGIETQPTRDGSAKWVVVRQDFGQDEFGRPSFHVLFTQVPPDADAQAVGQRMMAMKIDRIEGPNPRLTLNGGVTLTRPSAPAARPAPPAPPRPAAQPSQAMPQGPVKCPQCGRPVPGGRHCIFCDLDLPARR